MVEAMGRFAGIVAVDVTDIVFDADGMGRAAASAETGCLFGLEVVVCCGASASTTDVVGTPLMSGL
jgi:hypothetical protein